MGWLTSSFDICAVGLTPLVSYLGGSRKKPVFCGVGLLTMGLSFFVFVLPHVISGQYQAGKASANVSSVALCTANRTDPAEEACAEESVAGNVGYFSLFVLGMVLAGAGATPMYALGIPYIDENVKKKVAPMYVGAFTASGIVGEYDARMVGNSHKINTKTNDCSFLLSYRCFSRLRRCLPLLVHFRRTWCNDVTHTS